MMEMGIPVPAQASAMPMQSMYSQANAQNPRQQAFNVPPQMSNTTYDGNPVGSNMISVHDPHDSKSVVSGTSNATNKSKFRRYNLKDYQQLQSSMQNLKMGGLGANIGGEKWEVAKRKKIIEQQYAANLKLMNAYQQRQPGLPASNKQKERSAREKALEFAKNNIPKPGSRQRRSEYGEEQIIMDSRSGISRD